MGDLAPFCAPGLAGGCQPLMTTEHGNCSLPKTLPVCLNVQGFPFTVIVRGRLFVNGQEALGGLNGPAAGVILATSFQGEEVVASILYQSQVLLAAGGGAKAGEYWHVWW